MTMWTIDKGPTNCNRTSTMICSINQYTVKREKAESFYAILSSFFLMCGENKKAEVLKETIYKHKQKKG